MINISTPYPTEKLQLCFQIVAGEITKEMLTPDLAARLGYDAWRIYKWNFSWEDVQNMAEFTVNTYNSNAI